MNRFIEMEGSEGMILVEVEDDGSNTLELVSAKYHSSSLVATMSTLIKNGKAIIKQSRELSPDELELEFGIKGGVEAGVPVWGLAKVSGEGNITVKMLWKKEQAE